MSDLKPLIARLAGGAKLSEAEAMQAFDILMSGAATPAQIGGFLMGLRVRGETVPEILGAVRTMRAKMLPVAAPPGAIDVCGTGGDGAGTLNISTAVAFVCAAKGVPVAKHGNRAASSKSGAADVLAALGVNLEAEIPILERALAEIGTAFLWAQRHHSAMRHVGPSRVELGTRTIFNLMGPLSNPAGVKRQLIGVFAQSWQAPLAEVLAALGSEKVWLVHGADGLDEISLSGPTEIVEMEKGKIRSFAIRPEEFGIPVAPLSAIKGGDPAENAEALRAIFAGARNPYRDIVRLNAGAALLVAGRVADLPAGIALATQALDDGSAAAKLAALARLTNEGKTA